MSGPWDAAPLVRTDRSEVKATAYIREDRILISIGNFSDDPHEARLLIDWDRIGMKPDVARLKAPGIQDFQVEQEFPVTAPIPVLPRKGYLLYLEGLK
jgi:hypothetical protein